MYLLLTRTNSVQIMRNFVSAVTVVMYSQVFWSGNILLHQPSNSNYCVSLRQLAVALAITARATTSRAETSFCRAGCSPDHYGQGYKLVVALTIMVRATARIKISSWRR